MSDKLEPGLYWASPHWDVTNFCYLVRIHVNGSWSWVSENTILDQSYGRIGPRIPTPAELEEQGEWKPRDDLLCPKCGHDVCIVNTSYAQCLYCDGWVKVETRYRVKEKE